MSQPHLPQHFLDIARAHGDRAMPPVERWNPAYCGEIDMRITADGRWFYQGTPINRVPLVKLFASILRKDAERYVLVTPVERVGITVDDAPFLAVEMEESESNLGPAFHFRTNLDDIVLGGAEHPVRVELAPNGGFKPYIHIRAGLWALASRSVAFQIADRLIEEEGRPVFRSAGVSFPVPEADHG
jgi:uncharacterized protein